jgi:hypothetical protein
MNEMWKRIVASLLGGLVGGLIGKVVADKVLDDGYEWVEEDAVDVYEEGNARVTKEIVNEAQKVNYAAASNKDKIRLEDLAKKYKPGDESESVTEVEPGDESESVTEVEPFVISLTDYTEGDTYGIHDQKTLTYFAKDKILSDDTNEKVENPERLLGRRWQELFGQKSEDPDVVYIRSNSTLIDYEVVRLNQSYSEEVLGIYPEPEPDIKPAKRRVARKTRKVDTDESEEE